MNIPAPRLPPPRLENATGSSGVRARGPYLFVLLALWVAALLLVGADAARAGADPLEVVGVGRASSGQGSAVAAGRALRRAVGVVVHRHVSPDVYGLHRKWIDRRILGRSRRYVLRYAIGAERWVAGGIEVEVRATVDRGRLLSDLVAGGVAVRRLSAWPRLLVVAAEGDPLARSLEEELRGQGVRVRSLTLTAVRQEGPDDWALEALDLGCHLVVALAAEALSDEVEPDDLFSQESVRPEARALGTAWVFDARTLEVYGQVDVDESVAALSVVDAARWVRTRVSRGLAYGVVAKIEQSAWVPGGVATEVDVVVTGLPDARALDEVGVALGRLAEVGVVRLREIGHRQGRWRLEVSDPDVSWEALLSSAIPPRGHLFWLGNSVDVDPEGTFTVEARWVP